MIIACSLFFLGLMVVLFIKTTGRNPPTIAHIVDNLGWSAVGLVVVLALIVAAVVAGRKR